MERRLALVWMLALVSAGCDTEPTDLELESPDPTDRPSAGVVQVGENQFAVDFGAYEADQRLYRADWTRIARRSSNDPAPILGDWRAQDDELSFAGRVAAILDPPLSGRHHIALQWDALPIVEPPLEILTQLWLPPVENHPRVGIAWFIQEPDGTGRLNGWALVRNSLGWPTTGFYLARLYINSGRITWSVTRNDGFDAGGWMWIRLRHTVGSEQGTIRYRLWQGALEDEPSEWDVEQTSNYYGPHGGTIEPNISGKVGLYVTSSEKMEGVVPLWGAFTVGINGAPAPPPPVSSESKLVLECVPAEVERGDPTECTTSTDPASARLTVKEWSFASANGLSASEISDADSWAGPLVVSGTVTVRAEVDGAEQTATAQVVASPRRDWPEVPEFTVKEVSPGPLPDNPVQISDFGQVKWVPTSDDAVAAVAEVMSGPNQGVHYLTSIPYGVEAIVHVNTTALSVGSLFWQSQPPVSWTNAAGVRMCSRKDVVPFAAVVRRHEGIGLAEGSHARLYRDKLFEVAGPSVEDIVAAQPVEVLRDANQPFKSAMDAADLESDKADQGSNVPTYCLFTGIVY